MKVRCGARLLKCDDDFSAWSRDHRDQGIAVATTEGGVAVPALWK